MALLFLLTNRARTGETLRRSMGRLAGGGDVVGRHGEVRGHDRARLAMTQTEAELGMATTRGRARGGGVPDPAGKDGRPRWGADGPAGEAGPSAPADKVHTRLGQCRGGRA